MLQQVPRIGPAQAAAIADWQSCTNVHAEMDAAEQMGVRMVTLQDEDYPTALRRMADPPVVLYVRGEWQECDSTRGVAIVGTRRATPYGITVARKFGRELADAGCTIISGLARGIDTAAHTGALDAGGRTIAVAGFGLAELYPPENAGLVECILDGHGALVSEFPLYMRPNRNTFPSGTALWPPGAAPPWWWKPPTTAGPCTPPTWPPPTTAATSSPCQAPSRKPPPPGATP